MALPMKFEAGAEEHVLQAFELDVDADGFIAKDDERLTDGFDEPIRASNLDSILGFESYGYSVDDEGFAVNESGERFTEPYLAKEPFVVFEYEGELSALARIGFRETEWYAEYFE